MKPMDSAALASFLACWLPSANAGEALDSLAVARDLWTKMEPARYSYVVQVNTTVVTVCRGSNSKFYSLNPLRIWVQNGSVVRVDSERHGRLPASCLEMAHPSTISWLFDYIEGVRSSSDCHQKPVIEATYNSKYGFPSRIGSEGCVLDGHGYTVRDFRVLK